MNKNLTWNSRLLRTAGLALAWSCLALLPFAATGCGHKDASASEEKSKVVEVATMNPVRKDLTREVQQPGFLRPYEQTPIYTKIAGFAFEPKYDIGDHVRKGKVLVEVDVPEVVQELRLKAAKVLQAKADLVQATEASKAADAHKAAAKADIQAKVAAIASADAEVMRWYAEVVRGRDLLVKKLYDQQTLDQDVNQWRSSEAKKDEAKAIHMSSEAYFTKADANFNKSVADIEVAKAMVSVAEADHDQKRDWLAYRFIPAPYDGVVTLRNVHAGHFLQPSNSGSTSKAAEPLFVMMRTDKMRCVVDVPELDAVLVQDGDKAIIQFDAMPGVETYGTVSRNAGSLDDRTRTLRVEVWLKNPRGATISYTASKEEEGKKGGVITAVDPIPPEGGSGYPPNATIPLLIAGDKGQPMVVGGTGGTVMATTDGAGKVIRYELKSGGKDYTPGTKVTGDTICEILRPYMYAHATILGKVKNAWSLPAEVVKQDLLANMNRSYCFILGEDGKAHMTFLQIGARCNGELQILSKMRAGRNNWEPITGKEAVVMTNPGSLLDGQEVRLKTAAPKE